MRVYKSPVQLKGSNMQKKSSINFVKNIAGPKQIKSQNIYNQNSYQNVKHQMASMDKYHSKEQQSLCIIIKQEQQEQSYLQQSNSSKNIKNSIINKNTPSRSESQHKNGIKAYFPYSSQTEIKNLISFIHLQIQNNLVYLKSSNIYIDYILGLRQYKVKDLVQLLQKQQSNYNENQEDRTSNQNYHSSQKIHRSQMPSIQIIACQYQGIHDNNYLKNFDIIKCVGSGGFSKVYLVRVFGKLMAMKVINKDYIITNDKANIINNQKTILSICSEHPFITSLYSSFQTKHFLIFVLEFCNGGELFNLLRKVRRMKEEDAKFYFVQTLSAIAHLHRKGIVYRDIKPQNIIIDYEGHVRLADFGLSKLMQDTRQNKTYSFCGSAEYMAPEMLLKKGHSFQIDFYCLGALLYELVIGLPPYYSRNQSQLFSNIIHNNLQFPANVQLSSELKSFLSHLLQKQVDNRYKTLQQIMHDPWMRNVNLESVIDKRIKPPFSTDMFGYNFDDSDFAQQQKQITQKLKDEQKYSSFQDMQFPDFFYESRQISDIKCVIRKSKSQQQGIFMRTANPQIGQFIAESYNQSRVNSQSRINSNSGISGINNINDIVRGVKGSVVISKHSRQPSINRLEGSGHVGPSSSVQLSSSLIARRMDSVQRVDSMQRADSMQRYQQSGNPLNQVIYYQNPKTTLNTVRSLQHINTSSKSGAYNRSQQRIQQRVSSIQKINNIYTNKQQFHPFGIKSSNSSSLIASTTANNQNQKSLSYVRQPNYYSVQKSSDRGEGIRLDIQNLSIKNQRNYSMQKTKDIYSSALNNSHTYLPHHNNHSSTQNNNNFSLKHAVSAYELKKNFMDGFRDRFVPSTNKVKKSTLKNGQKISVSMLNNLHYRN